MHLFSHPIVLIVVVFFLTVCACLHVFTFAACTYRVVVQQLEIHLAGFFICSFFSFLRGGWGGGECRPRSARMQIVPATVSAFLKSTVRRSNISTVLTGSRETLSNGFFFFFVGANVHTRRSLGHARTPTHTHTHTHTRSCSCGAAHSKLSPKKKGEIVLKKSIKYKTIDVLSSLSSSVSYLHAYRYVHCTTVELMDCLDTVQFSVICNSAYMTWPCADQMVFSNSTPVFLSLSAFFMWFFVCSLFHRALFAIPRIYVLGGGGSAAT